MRNSSRPSASSCITSVIAGTWRSMRTASKRHCSIVSAFQGSKVAHAI